ncbi:tetratricopeptide (TPR) repeat protein [Evansella vedderi]|uniref:Tetratricopeptide (TPR) repeat protein n=1 Tax=Evansella vedderi TaxID=38282 RepID=A0ABU0A1U8_9BACI|nr:tetratricopeptide repeat protein [Evansella vedderi]MDQ0257463.1 tetratricopeptide (TPR) repeat protein [Evansella vedderi]
MNHQLQEAIQLIEQGYHEKGLMKIEKLRNIADDEGKRSIAELYYELGLVDRSLELIEELMFQYPDHGELFAFAAECYSELGKEDDAIDMLMEIKKGDSAYVQAQLLLADIYQNQGLEEVAEQKLLEAEKSSPDEPILLYGLGEFYLSRGDYQQSIPYFKRVIYQDDLKNIEELNPYLRIAEAYSATGQFEDALTNYEKGIETNEDINGLFGYGYTALQIEDYETAIKQFSRLKELDPDFTTLYPFLAKALRNKNRMKEALEVLQEGIYKDEYNEELYLEMAKTQFATGNSEEGKSFLEKVIAINPSNVTAVKELLMFFMEMEDFGGVIELLSFLEDYGEYDPLFERYKAKALYEEDDLKNALKAYEAALDAFGDDIEVLEEAAYAYLEAGEKENGIRLLEKLFTLSPDRTDVEERLRDLTEGAN